MAGKKKKGSAFEYEAIGRAIPKDYVLVKNPDGTISYLPPDEAKKREKKK